MDSYNNSNFKKYCNIVRKANVIINTIHKQYGYPPFWQRPLHFSSFVKTILEQQVSLASANAVYNKIKNNVKYVTVNNLVQLKEEGLKQLGVTKQKAHYIYLLANYFLENKNYLQTIQLLTVEDLKLNLLQHKGIGQWSANVLLLMVFNKINIYPPGDVALIKSIQLAHNINYKLTNETAAQIIETNNPYKSIAVCYYYWYYINVRRINFIV